VTTRQPLPLDAAFPRPLLRGWLHAVAVAGGVATTVALCLQCAGDPPRMLSMLVYGLSMCALFAASALYHLGSWPPVWHARLRALDHASIFGLIAGTYTPIAFNVLEGWERLAILVVIWVLAAVGIALSVHSLRLPRAASTVLYVGMGWTALAAAPSLLRALPAAAITTLVAGGLAYTAGALVYALRRPDPFPRVFGFHEVFHALVVAANAAFATAIWLWVVPFPRA
jgi:hemolysin III